jgi:catechol 2,3-dioxygenase-like lactoylglutathione lyase family enzyme
MNTQTKTEVNVEQAVPFFAVSNMEQSLRFYMDGLGFQMKRKWIDEGKLSWCWLELGKAALMLQEFREKGHDSWRPAAKVGVGVSICFQCRDALAIYHQAIERGLQPKRPFVGNRMWVVVFTDPDGYKLDFESPTDAPEDTEYKD